MYKKLLTLFLVSIFLVTLIGGCVSAEEISTFDNIKFYDEDTKTITMFNTLGLRNIATVQLTTPLDNHVGLGYQKVAEFPIDLLDDTYTDAFGEMVFIDVRTEEEIQVDFDYKYRVTTEHVVNDYEQVCKETYLNGTTKCSSVVVGNHIVERYAWEDLDTKTLIKGEVIVGIFTDVKQGDKIEWIPTLFGKEVDEWAVWTSDLNTDLIMAFNLNEGAGAAGVIVDELDFSNGTNSGATNRSGVIDSAYQFAGGESDYINLNTQTHLHDGMSVSVWLREFTAGGIQYAIGKSNDFILGYLGDCTNFCFAFNDGGWRTVENNANLLNNTWVHVVATYNTTMMRIYLNGTNVANTTYVGDIPSTAFNWTLGAANQVVNNPWDGGMDMAYFYNRTLTESEVLRLYNDGNGIEYTASFTPEITLNSPIDNYNSSTAGITFNGTVGVSFGVDNVSLIINDLYIETNTSGLNFTNYLFTSTLSEGNSNWTYESCNSDGCTNATARDITIDTSAPKINITDPTQAQNFNYLSSGNNLTLNVTFNDPLLSICWYNYNSTNNTFVCSSETPVASNVSLTNQTTLTVYANDTLGRVNSSSVSWTFNLFDFNNYTYTTSVLESTINKFTGWFQTKDSLTSSSLEYNNTNNSAISVSLGSNVYRLSYSPTAPEVGTSTNISWRFWANDVNATLFNQTVTSLLGDDCTVYTKKVLNFTLYDEENPTTALQNTTMNYAFNIFNKEGSELMLRLNGTVQTNPLGICLNSTLEDTNLSFNGAVKFFANASTTNYIIRYYNFLNGTISNATSPQNISLYSINSTKTLPFLLTFRDEDSALAPNILINVNKQYLETNDFKTVEVPLTDTNGQTILNLIRNTAVYNLIMINSKGEIVSTFNNVVAFCQDFTIQDCSIDLSASGEGDLTYDLNEDIGISYILSYSNGTTSVSLTFNSLTATSKEMRLETISQNQFENQSICTDSLTAASGTLTCNVSSALATNQILFSKIYVGDELISTETVYTNPLLPSKGGVFGKSGFFLAFLFILFIILLFADDKQVLVISIGIGWIVVISLGLVRGALIGSASGGVWLIITILIFLWKLKEEQKF